MTGRQVQRVFDELRRQAEEVCGPLQVRFTLGHPDDFPKKRNYAFCTNPDHGHEFGTDPGWCLIVVAPKILKAEVPRVLGLLMHELGHAVDFLCTPDHPEHGSERRADAIAQHIWGIPIRYDGDTVQSTCCGVHPRPPELGL
jgi:hypothetical protein